MDTTELKLIKKNIILKFLLKTYCTLFNNNVSIWKYCLNSWALTTIPAIIIMNAIVFLFNINEGEKINAIELNGLFNFLKNIFINPIIETFFIAFFIHWLVQFFKKSTHVIIVSSVLFAALHFRIEYPFWFFGVLWPSLILTTSFLTWRSISFWKAYTVCTAIHILHNGSAFLLSQFF